MKRITISLLTGGSLGAEFVFMNEPCSLNMRGLPNIEVPYLKGEKQYLDPKSIPKALYSGCVKSGLSPYVQMPNIVSKYEVKDDNRREVTCSISGETVAFAVLMYPLPKWRPGALILGNMYSGMEQDEDLICQKLLYRKEVITMALRNSSDSEVSFEKAGAYLIEGLTEEEVLIQVHNEKKFDDRNSSPITVATDHESSLTGGNEIKVEKEGLYVPVSTLKENDHSDDSVAQQHEEHHADDLVDSRIVDVSNIDAAPGVQGSPQVPSSEEIDHLDDSGVVSIDSTLADEANNNMVVPAELPVDDKDVARSQKDGNTDIEHAQYDVVHQGIVQHVPFSDSVVNKDRYDELGQNIQKSDAVAVAEESHRVTGEVRAHNRLEELIKDKANIRKSITFFASAFKKFYHQLFGKDATKPDANDEDIRLAAKEYYAQLEGERVVVHTGNAVDTYLNDGKGNVQIAKYQSVSDTEPDVKSLKELLGDIDFQRVSKDLIVHKIRLGETTYISCKRQNSMFDVHRFRPVVKDDETLEAKNECLGMLNNNALRFEETTDSKDLTASKKNPDQGKFSWRDWRTWGK